MNLHADRRVLLSGHPARVRNDGIKLFRNDENTIAIGISGVIPKQQDLLKLFVISELLFTEMYKGEFANRLDSNEFVESSVNNLDINFIAITSNRAFKCVEGIYFVQTDQMTGLGTGHRSIVACYYVLNDIKLAFQVSSEIDIMSSTEYMSIMASSLKPFVIG